MEAAIFPRERFASGHYPSAGGLFLAFGYEWRTFGEYREGDVSLCRSY